MVSNKVHPTTPENQTDLIQSIIGEFGRWQLFVCLVIFLVKFTIAWHQIGIVFLAPPVQFNCSSEQFTQCDANCPSHVFDTSVFKQTIVTEWDLVCDRALLANVAQMVFMVGILVGNLLFGYFSDRYGRRNPLVAAVILQVVSGVGASFAPQLWIFITLRFFCAMATGGTMLTSFVIVMEIVGKKYRTILGVFFQLPFNLGHASLGLFGYLIRDWHHFQMAISIPSILLISYYWLVPESPRWLLTAGRNQQCVNVLKKAATWNKRPTYTVQEKITKHLNEISQQKTTKQGGNFMDLIRSKEMRIRTICICVNWIVIGLVFYGVAQFMGQISGNIFTNVAISGLVQVPGNFLCVYLMDKIGRKYTLIGSYLLCSVSILLIMIPKPENLFWPTTFLGCIGMMSIAVCFSIIYVFTGELYSTTVRNVGLGTASTFARFGSMVAPFISTLNKQRAWLPPFIFGLLPLVALLFVLRLPETLHSQLPDTIEEAEQVGMEPTMQPSKNDTNDS